MDKALSWDTHTFSLVLGRTDGPTVIARENQLPENQPITDSWTRAVDLLTTRGEIGRAQLAFVGLTRPLGVIDGTILLAVPSDFAKDFLETRARIPITEALAEIVGEPVRFAVTVDPTLEETATPPPDNDDDKRNEQSAPSARSPERPAEERPVPQRSAADRGSSVEDHGADSARLNPKYTFETFVTGSSNRFAHAAATAVAEAPAKAYNPLFIYGGSGLGKTHLLHAIGHYARNLYPGIRVRYVNSEEFTNDFINSIRDDKAEVFQRRYRNVDVLLIDDIQFLGGKEQTVEEFFHTFNSLHNDNKQVVITSDLPPKQLEGFEDRLRSRFEWGLLTDVQPPDLETRIAILRKKAVNENLQASPEVLEYIASRISTNIRELEGALIRVTAFANLNRQPVELSLAEMVLKDLITDPEGEDITPSLIMSQTANYFSITIEALCSADRSRVLVNARQIAMYLCRELTDLSLPKIGQLFGGRDHTTVMHANRKIREQMAEKRSTFNQVTELTNRIKQKARSA
ncbi:chromosomal replication initiator protein DnaA [Georgenia halophila]|uniref:chromosomal replication initiator protein DnaA n=1 Tax=Georgenia halophila TaxID=620889 RepID=UPI003CD06863